MTSETSGWATGVEVCRYPGEVIIVGNPLILGPLVDACPRSSYFWLGTFMLHCGLKPIPTVGMVPLGW